MNIFDAIVIGMMLLAVVTGFRSGLLRSGATILGYIAAAPIAVAATPKLTLLLPPQYKSLGEQNGMLFFVVLLASGLLIGAMLRSSVSAIAGEDISAPDRAAGAMLGAIRIILLAVFMVLIFDRVIPAGRQPDWLAQSKLRPLLSAAGQQGLRTLPPSMTAQIDKMKRDRGI